MRRERNERRINAAPISINPNSPISGILLAVRGIWPFDWLSDEVLFVVELRVLELLYELLEELEGEVLFCPWSDALSELELLLE